MEGHERYEPLPREQFHDGKGKVVGDSGIGVAIVLHGGQRMRKGTGWAPRHSKDHVQRDAQLLGAMDMGHGRRIGNDSVGDEEISGFRHIGSSDAFSHSIPGLDAAAPGTVDDVPHLLSSSSHVASTNTLSRRKQARVAHHVGHQGAWITSNAEELDALLFDKVLEDGMRTNADAMIERRARELLGDGDEGLDISSRSHNVNGHVQTRARGRLGTFWKSNGAKLALLAGLGWRWDALEVLEPGDDGPSIAVALDLDAAVELDVARADVFCIWVAISKGEVAEAMRFGATEGHLADKQGTLVHVGESMGLEVRSMQIKLGRRDIKDGTGQGNEMKESEEMNKAFQLQRR